MSESITKDPLPPGIADCSYPGCNFPGVNVILLERIQGSKNVHLCNEHRSDLKRWETILDVVWTEEFNADDAKKIDETFRVRNVEELKDLAKSLIYTPKYVEKRQRHILVTIETREPGGIGRREWNDLRKRLGQEFGDVLSNYGASTLWDLRKFWIIDAQSWRELGSGG